MVTEIRLKSQKVAIFKTEKSQMFALRPHSLSDVTDINAVMCDSVPPVPRNSVVEDAGAVVAALDAMTSSVT